MAAVNSSRPYHIIILGASGFTGQFVVEEVARCAAESAGGGSLNWAVAGRSRRRLEGVLEQAAGRLCTCPAETRGSAARILDIQVVVLLASLEGSWSGY